MKALLFPLLLLLSTGIQATACKCNCDPTDRRICAGLYDIEHPCGAICASPAPVPGVTPMITACPVRQVVNRITGAREWLSDCANY